MSPTETQANGSRMTNQSKYQPVEYDPTELSPDARPGKYQVVIGKITCKPHPEYGYPKVTIIHMIEEELSGIEDNAEFVGAELMKTITLYPNNERRGNMGKEDLQRLCTATGVDIATFPKRITNPDVDLRDFFESLKGQRLPVWVTTSELPSREDPEVMRTFTNVNYEEPRNFNAMLGIAEEEVVEEEEEKPAPRGRAPAKPAPKKTAARSARR